jgi:hypothetical protein
LAGSLSVGDPASDDGVGTGFECGAVAGQLGVLDEVPGEQRFAGVRLGSSELATASGQNYSESLLSLAKQTIAETPTGGVASR